MLLPNETGGGVLESLEHGLVQHGQLVSVKKKRLNSTIAGRYFSLLYEGYVCAVRCIRKL